MKKYLIISFLLAQVNVFGQIYVNIDKKQTNEGYEISIINDNSIDTADIDNDCITDTIRYDKNAKTYVAILSSLKNKPVYINNLGYVWFYENTFISAEKGGLSVNSESMRSSNQMTYKYENSTKRLRLSEISNESMGNTGRGIEKIDFINNKFVADWYYFDDDMDEIIGIPTFEINIDSKPIFSDDTVTYTNINFYINSDSLYYQNKCKSIIDERGKRIDTINLLKMKMPVVEPENINDNSEEEIFTIEISPEFPGGEAELRKWLRNNLEYPKECVDGAIGGRVICTFVVEKDGSLSNIKILRSIHPLLDKEAVRVIGKMPKWTPGRQHGKPVRSKYTMPIKFALD